MSCICFEPGSRSRTANTTNCAPTKAKGIMTMIDAKSETNASTCSLASFEIGSDWMLPATDQRPPVAIALAAANACDYVGLVSVHARIVAEYTDAQGREMAAIEARHGDPATGALPPGGDAPFRHFTHRKPAILVVSANALIV